MSSQEEDRQFIYLVIGDEKSGKSSLISNITRKKIDGNSLPFGITYDYIELMYNDRPVDVSFYESSFQGLNYLTRIFKNNIKLLLRLNILLVVQNTSSSFTFADLQSKFSKIKDFVSSVTQNLTDEENESLSDRFTKIHGITSEKSPFTIPCLFVLHKFDKFLSSEL
jgi:hypothetical protein